MVSSESPADQSSQPESSAAKSASGQRVRSLQICFCTLVILLAIFQFSENTTDVDLWGHVIFGQAMIKTQSIPKAEIYSWTAAGQPWVSHEVLAEVFLGGAHMLMGGNGLLFLKLAMGLLSFGIALRMGIADLTWPEKFIPWTVAALAAVEISFGFAARPQIFTAVFLVLELLLLSRIHAGKHLWALAMPLLFFIWINTHGGVLAGFGLLGLCAGATTAQMILQKQFPSSTNAADLSPKTIIALWLSVIACGGALFINPWGMKLIRWLIGSVLWLRPEIEEWNPTPLGWDHGVLFALIILAAFAWIFTRRPRAWWKMAACGAFAVLALRSVRNAPLCALLLLALAPPHLASTLGRFRNSLGGFVELGRSAGFQKFALVAMSVCGLGIAIATFTLHKENPFTMEISSAQFPNAAVAFLREHQLHGKTLVFFDWGEMVIFHLPDCPPSIDGRLDACYSQDLIKAHWKMYNGEPFDEKVLNVEEADLALLPANLAGGHELANRPGWKAIYYDNTAVILARHWERFPQLASLTLPIKGPAGASKGRVAFLDKSPRWK